MAFPVLSPSSRDFTAGDYPVKTFTAQSGAEVRILYGSKRTGMTISLDYENIADTAADDFVAHFDEVRGTYDTFALPSEVLTGWTGASTALDSSNTGIRWRYAQAPAITNIRPGRSSVRVELVGVL
jgi:hypothetical protein